MVRSSLGSDPVEQKVHDAILMGIVALCIALNVGLGVAVYVLKLPIYLDAVGTIACALLAGNLGWRGCVYSAFVGATSFVITGLLLNPVVIWFIPTQIAIASYSFYVARPAVRDTITNEPLSFVSIVRLALVGIGLGIVSGVVSAPIIALVFGGITGAGASLIVTVLLKSGQNLYTSVITSGLASEPLDKTLQLFTAIVLIRATPMRVRSAFT